MHSAASLLPCRSPKNAEPEKFRQSEKHAAWNAAAESGQAAHPVHTGRQRSRLAAERAWSQVPGPLPAPPQPP